MEGERRRWKWRMVHRWLILQNWSVIRHHSPALQVPMGLRVIVATAPLLAFTKKSLSGSRNSKLQSFFGSRTLWSWTFIKNPHSCSYRNMISHSSIDPRISWSENNSSSQIVLYVNFHLVFNEYLSVLPKYHQPMLSARVEAIPRVCEPLL